MSLVEVFEGVTVCLPLSELDELKRIAVQMVGKNKEIDDLQSELQAGKVKWALSLAEAIKRAESAEAALEDMAGVMNSHFDEAKDQWECVEDRGKLLASFMELQEDYQAMKQERDELMDEVARLKRAG